uniref:Glycosyl hydrolase family 13 catalytic domain-containing protein n=1 Tax=Lactuca sativa TaxID=4236 RepID=A0A9R1WMJ6_LACSA|nr:hypothetical protein LSAT_V11C100035210 [Lactuca sativa]
MMLLNCSVWCIKCHWNLLSEVNRKEPVNNGMLLLLPKEELEDEASPITTSTKCRGSRVLQLFRMWKHLQLQPSYCALIHSRLLEFILYSKFCFMNPSYTYWVTEMHVDGFRFDLASIMTRGSTLFDVVNVYGNQVEDDLLTTGSPLTNPPLIDMISNDPILLGVKLIAEAWDCGCLYQVGVFPHWGIWSELNGKYRDTVRQFIKGTDGSSGAFAECLCGSPNLYQEGGRIPRNNVNFICAHDGFTLADLVMYNHKHNLANGEDNKDGESHNNRWNCRQEGEFVSISVKRLRKRQRRTFFLCLMVSQGVPMIHMGDEYGHTKGRNNMNYFQWDKKEESSSDFFRFCRLVTNFLHECEALGLNDFPIAERL